jgi:hypothetical protein
MTVGELKALLENEDDDTQVYCYMNSEKIGKQWCVVTSGKSSYTNHTVELYIRKSDSGDVVVGKVVGTDEVKDIIKLMRDNANMMREVAKDHAFVAVTTPSNPNTNIIECHKAHGMELAWDQAVKMLEEVIKGK